MKHTWAENMLYWEVDIEEHILPHVGEGLASVKGLYPLRKPPVKLLLDKFQQWHWNWGGAATEHA